MERIDRPRNERTDQTRTTPKQATVPATPVPLSGSPNARTAPHHALLYEERDDTEQNGTKRNEASKQRDEPTSETRARERERLEHHGYKQRPAEKIQ